MKGRYGITEASVFRRPRCPCGKIGFDKKGAQTKRNSLKGRGRIDELRIYPCPRSSEWHLTKRL